MDRQVSRDNLGTEKNGLPVNAVTMAAPTESVHVTRLGEAPLYFGRRFRRRKVPRYCRM
jgi:hypothetical protein